MDIILNIISAMKQVTMVDLRTHSEQIVRELLRGVRMTLSFRGKVVAELVPLTSAGRSPLNALERAQAAAARDQRHAENVATYLRGLREDQRDWTDRS